MILFLSTNQTKGASFWKCVLWLLLVLGGTSKHMTSTSSSSFALQTREESQHHYSPPYPLLIVTNPPAKMNATQSPSATDPYEEFNTTSVITITTNETESTCKREQCERKCCPNGQLFDAEKSLCEDTSLYGINITTDHDPGNKTIIGFEAMHEMWMRGENESTTCGYFSKYDVSVLRGFLRVAKQLSLRENFICEDKEYRSGEVVEIIFACYYSPTTKDKILVTLLQLLNTLYIPVQILSFISISLLVLLLLIYFASPANKDLQLKCTMSLGASMLLRISLRLLYYLFREDPLFEERDTCGIIAVSRTYTYLCVSCCLNVLFFELSRIIRGSMKLIPIKELTKSKWRFPCYLAYSWGGPLVFCILIFSLYLPEDLLQDTSIKPSFIPKFCISNLFHLSSNLFTNGPMWLLFIVDTVFMVHVTYLLHKEQVLRFCSKSTTQPVQIRTHCSKNYLALFKQRLYIYGVFLLMKLARVFGALIHNSTLFSVAIILFTSDVLGAMILFFVVFKSNDFLLPKTTYLRLSSAVRRVTSNVISRIHPTDSSTKKTARN